MTFCLVCASAPAAEKVALIKINGAIGPATASFIARSIDEARTQNAQCLVIQLNTPGGLLDSTQTIVQDFLGSTVPVVVYVSPTGATATSAGCFITLAANVAAMAPATTIGAAHPVMLGGIPSGQEQKPDETMKHFGELYRDNRRQAPSQCRLGEIRRPRKCIDHRGESARIKSDRFNRRGYP